jgi:hypothetical protein
LDIFKIFGGWIGIVETQVADAARDVIGYAEIQADRFRMADMEIAVWLGWKTRDYSAAMFAGCVVIGHDISDKV